MARSIVAFAFVLLLAGCAAPAAEEIAPEPSLVVDADRPAPEAGDVVTGPAVEPDLNATTAAPPRLAVGEWWRIRVGTTIGGGLEMPDLVRVVANVTEDGYIIGMPHEGWIKEAISFHSPGFGDITPTLGYNTHNILFEPVRFPLKQGDTWETVFATAKFVATVETADEYTAEILFSPQSNGEPTEPATNALGLTGGGSMRLVYDARMHEIVRMESDIGAWEVIEHGYGFEGWVTVPRGEHTAIDYGQMGPVTPGQVGTTRTIEVEGGFNRLTMMHIVLPMGPGSYRLRSVTPKGEEFVTEGSTALVARFYEAYNPDGTWTQEDFVAGPGATYSMGIAYHQYDIHLPDGAKRTDHAHPVIR